VDETRNQQTEGTGLGLAIAKSLTDLMGGELTVESVYGEGSDFCVYIPQKKSDPEKLVVEEGQADKSENTEEIRTKRSFTTSDLRVMIVDDNPVNLTVEKLLMEKYGMTVDTAESGMECLDILRTKQYDLIFMDHMMPELDGVETMHKIHEEKLCEGAPVIVVTANAIVGVEGEMRKLGFDGYVSKPIDMRNLERELLRLLPREKIHMYHDTVHAGDEKALAETLMEYGVDVKKGLNYCEDMDMYIEILEIALKDMPDKMAKLELYCADRDVTRYTALVHSIKSACANM
jgi:CheY-like chemotaxis protein